MNNEQEQDRIWAVDRYLSGEEPQSIITSLRKTRSWLYKWISRYESGDSFWYREKSRSPNTVSLKTQPAIEEIVKSVRLSLN